MTTPSRERPYDTTEPEGLGSVLSSLFARKGYGKAQSSRQLHELWNDSVDIDVAAVTKVLNLRNGVLQVAVANSAMLSELASFRRMEILAKLKETTSGHQIKDLKFKLRSQLKSR
ncbi:MAG TPA: DUF721 domain-containing protein [Planctomicrobium sp.]|nr:DUF721 domain-containing protein [Planctomicrobium sp.]